MHVAALRIRRGSFGVSYTINYEESPTTPVLIINPRSEVFRVSCLALNKARKPTSTLLQNP